jgi:hypothetical protein
VELIGRIFIDILRHFVPISATLRTLDTLTTIHHLRCVGLSPLSEGDSIIAQPLAPANGVSQMLQDPLLRDEVHGQEILDDVRKHSRSQGWLTKVPERSAMSAQTKHLTRGQILTVKRSLSGATQCCARTKKSVRARDLNVIYDNS